MFIVIEDNYRISSFNLLDNLIYKGIHIYRKNSNFYMDLKTGYYFVDNSKTKQLIKDIYEIRVDDYLYTIKIYVYENNQGYDDYKLYSNIDFIIANNDKANIICCDPFLKNNYLAIKNGIIDSNYNVSVNNHKYNNERLNDGDTIEYVGIRIIYFDDFLYINSFNIVNRLKEYKEHSAIFKYKLVNKPNNFYIPQDIYEIKIDEIHDYEEIKTSNDNYIKTILPSLIMCISMSIMAYINYNSNSNNANTLSYMLMPISMFLTGIMIPCIFIIINSYSIKKNSISNKEKYIKYLKDYKINLDKQIESYVNSKNSRFFNLLSSEDRIFYINSKSPDFLTISIGKIVESLDIKLKKTNDNDINNYLDKIQLGANNICNCPLFLNIKNNRTTTIVCKKSDKLYFLYAMILEVSYKHHYDDIAIGIYAKDDNVFNPIYNLPHLFVNGYRLTMNNINQLQDIDQLKIDRPLILFIYDHCDYVFSNKNIHIIYISDDINDIYKDSDAIVEYFNNDGNLYLDRKIPFTYIKESIDFNKYFSYLGRYSNFNKETNPLNFNTIFKDEIVEYYKNSNHTLNASFSYNNNEIINFDLHESKQGPHGLIGGSTGSGKSEFIVSFLLSLCIRYSPEYLNIVLIDYKGGGIEDSLTYKNISIPHIVASVSNLQDYALERLIIALHNECKRRQILFKKLSEQCNISIMNIDDYLNNNTKLETVSHLLIVVDEFAELKKQNPEQIKELISISRIGRSLGIHLILATQKPAGVIDDEIWSNSRFKIALKVFDEKDSMDLIKCKDAAYLTNPGSFLMLVDSSITKGQSIYTKNDINNNDPYKVSILDSQLKKIKTYKKQEYEINSICNYYCNRIIQASNELKCRTHKIEYLPPPNKIRHQLTKDCCIALGEIDDYLNNSKGLLAFDIKDSILIYSNRKYEINAILNSLNENCRHTIVISNNKYIGKYISDSLIYDDSEDIDYLFRKIVSNTNNDFTLIIEDISCLLSYDETYLDKLSKIIKRKDSLNISIICLTSNSQISFKLINLFKNKIMININDIGDLSYFYGTRGQYKGKSFYYNDEPKCFVPIQIEKYIENKPIIDNLILHIPDIIEPNIINSKYLIGYDIDTKEQVLVDADINIVSYNEDLLDKYKRAYENLNTYIYDYHLAINDNILWLGPGIFSQRLFITGLKDDLNNDEGIYINRNHKVIIRSLNYE